MEGKGVFKFSTGQPLEVTPAMKQQFDDDGYVIVRYVLTGQLAKFEVAC